jgi:hypothetical protein
MKEQSGGLAYVLYAGSPADQPNIYIFSSPNKALLPAHLTPRYLEPFGRHL